MDSFYSTVRYASMPIFRLWFSLRAEGVDNVPADGPVILAGNHVSFLDPAVLGSVCPRKVHFLMHSGIHRARGLGWFFRGMDAIPVDRDGSQRRAIRAALALLEEGQAVGIFPEGARARVGENLAPLDGVALIARRSGVPVVPVGITGTERALPKGASLPSPTPVVVRFGEPLVRTEALGRDAARSADERFTRSLMCRVAELSRLSEKAERAS